MWVYIYTFLKTVILVLLYSLTYFSSNKYICTFSALNDTNCVIRASYISKCFNFKSVHTKWNIWSSFHQTDIKPRYSGFLSDYVKGLRGWALIRLLLQINFIYCRMMRRFPFSQLHVVTCTCDGYSSNRLK
jgi:hypothetical protein